ncbi:MAG: hypothetical protein R6U41_03110 [Desulfosalsimonas sp.]|uniref:hypothetical protein n=1 Tax=Desulfosalsimonas sp. TaxID=3073848 RepID=UPI003970F2A8
MKKYITLILLVLFTMGFSLGCEAPEEPGQGGQQQQQQQAPGQQPDGEEEESY